MLQNYLKLALRNLLRTRLFSAINIGGLAAGLACVILLFLFIQHELAVDTIFSKGDRIYRINSDWKDPAMGMPFTTLSPLGAAMAREYPDDIENSVCYTLITAQLTIGNQDNYREPMMIADSNFFRIFDYDFLHGDPATALHQPNSVIISETIAEKFFGSTDVLNRVITFHLWQENAHRDYKITGVLKEFPYNSISYLDEEYFGMIVPMENVGDFFSANYAADWDNRYAINYILLSESASPASVERYFPKVLEKYADEDVQENLTPALERLTDIYLAAYDGKAGDAVKMLAMIALFILMIAGINFMNLSTARAVNRATEIGVRKVLGADRKKLMGQFLGESMLLTVIAAVVAICLTFILLPFFNEFTGKHLLFSNLITANMLIGLFFLIITVGVLSGLYPAFIMSAFQPVSVLKSGRNRKKSSFFFRRLLVVFQFLIAIVLLIGVGIIRQQLDFLLSREMGFEKENVLAISSVPRDWSLSGVRQLETVKSDIRRLPGVLSVSHSFSVPGANIGSTSAFSRPQWGKDRSVSLASYAVGSNFLKTFNLQLLEGRFFSEEVASDSGAIVINETAKQALELESIEGEYLKFRDMEIPVLGVVKDFNFESLHHTVRPMYFSFGDPYYRFLSLKLAGENIHDTISGIENFWRERYPAAPLVFSFIDDSIDELYKREVQMKQVTGFATMLAVIIACLGIFGLVTLNISQRMKEIGVRKVLGASLPRIVFLFAKEFIWLISIAAMIAAPIAYYAMNYWLESFAYRVDMTVGIFILSGSFALLLALVIVVIQAVKAGLLNPVDALRYE